MVGNPRYTNIFMYSLVILVLFFIVSCGSDSSSSSSTNDPANGNSVASWTHPTDLTDGILTAGGFPYYPQVAMAKNGDLGLIYVDEDNDGDPRIYLSEYRNGAWTHPATVNNSISLVGSDVVDFSYNIPQIAMSDNGDTVVTWMQDDITLGGSECYFMSEYRNGTWTHPVDLDDHLNVGPGGTFDGPAKIAMSGSGETVIVWSQNIQTGPQRIFISEYRNGSWTHPVDNTADYISADVWGCNDPQASMNDGGETILTWIQRIASGSTDKNIVKSDYRNSTWTLQSGTNDYISPDAYGFERKPLSAISNNGDAVIVWRQGTNDDLYDTDSKVFMSEYRNGSWTPPADLDDFIGLPGTETPAGDPEVAMDDNGNTVVVWAQRDGTVSRLYMSHYENGTWTHPGVDDYISPDGTEGISDYKVAMSGSGDAIVVWLQRDGSGDKQLFMSEYRGGVWAHPTSTNEFISIAGQEVYDVDLAMDDNGNAIIVWRQYDGINDRLFMSVYK